MGEILVLIEQDHGELKQTSLHAITLAGQLGRDYALLVLGHGVDKIATSLVSYGASAVIVADDPALAEPLADRYATVIAEVARKRGAMTLLGTSSTLSKDILPRAAARCWWRRWLRAGSRLNKRMARLRTGAQSMPVACWLQSRSTASGSSSRRAPLRSKRRLLPTESARLRGSS